MNKQTFTLSKQNTLFFWPLSIALLLASCGLFEKNDEERLGLPDTQWELEYVQTPEGKLFPESDFYAIEFIGENSVMTYYRPDLDRHTCISCFGSYKAGPADSLHISWDCVWVGRPIQCRSTIGFIYEDLISRTVEFHRGRQSLKLFSKSDTSEYHFMLNFKSIIDE
jgi:hypothetical protein